MPTGQIVPATIRDLTTGAVVTCDFRPKELALGREIEWTPGKAVGRTMDKPKYTKGSPTKLQLEPSRDYPGQNPTSGGHDGYAFHQVIEGETIDIIAFQEYGSRTAWRHLAEVNNLDDPSRLAPGQRLLLVPLPV